MKPLSLNKINAIGLMSGTSLDGLDMVAARFWQINGIWKFSIEHAKTLPYSKHWLEKLKNSPHFSGEELIELHTSYGQFLGSETKRFINETNFKPDLISSHGHTVFHQPDKGFTYQTGNGADIAAITKITTVCDFRTGDVALGGQGAPLVPVGDSLLFSEYEYCLNLGGFANISYEKNGNRIAFDICPVNIILNHFAEKEGLVYDKNGELGRKGKVNIELLKKLNQLDFYLAEPPKSLGREWVEQVFMKVLSDFEITEEDKLRTIYEHLAIQIGKLVSENGKLLITGGGAFNAFLIELISGKTQVELVIPANDIINFKEALIFAFLGVLKMRGEINCLASVTGAKCDSSAGLIYS